MCEYVCLCVCLSVCVSVCVYVCVRLRGHACVCRTHSRSCCTWSISILIRIRPLAFAGEVCEAFCYPFKSHNQVRQLQQMCQNIM